MPIFLKTSVFSSLPLFDHCLLAKPSLILQCGLLVGGRRNAIFFQVSIIRSSTSLKILSASSSLHVSVKFYLDNCLAPMNWGQS